MSLSHELVTYHPAEMWQPPTVSEALHKQVSAFTSAGRYSPSADILIANALSEETLTHFRDGNSYGIGAGGPTIHPVYRAAKARETGEGNCMAHAEATAAIGTALGLQMSITWEQRGYAPGHASTIWDSSRTIWDVDGLMHFAKVRKPFNADSSPGAPVSMETGRQLIAASGGRLALRNSDDPTKALDWQPLPAVLGEADVPFGDYTYILPAEEGVRMLAAMGDAQRYQQTQPERWEALRDEIEQFIPPSLRPVQRVQ